MLTKQKTDGAQCPGMDSDVIISNAVYVNELSADIVNNINNELYKINNAIDPESIPLRLREIKRFHGSAVFDRLPSGHFITRDSKEWFNGGNPGFTVWQLIERSGDIVRHCPPQHFPNITQARAYVQKLLRRESFLNDDDFIFKRSKFDKANHIR